MLLLLDRLVCLACCSVGPLAVGSGLRHADLHAWHLELLLLLAATNCWAVRLPAGRPSKHRASSAAPCTATYVAQCSVCAFVFHRAGQPQDILCVTAGTCSWGAKPVRGTVTSLTWSTRSLTCALCQPRLPLLSAQMLLTLSDAKIYWGCTLHSADTEQVFNWELRHTVYRHDAGSLAHPAVQHMVPCGR